MAGEGADCVDGMLYVHTAATVRRVLPAASNWCLQGSSIEYTRGGGDQL